MKTIVMAAILICCQVCHLIQNSKAHPHNSAKQATDFYGSKKQTNTNSEDKLRNQRTLNDEYEQISRASFSSIINEDFTERKWSDGNDKFDSLDSEEKRLFAIELLRMLHEQYGKKSSSYSDKHEQQLEKTTTTTTNYDDTKKENRNSLFSSSTTNRQLASGIIGSLSGFGSMTLAANVNDNADANNNINNNMIMNQLLSALNADGDVRRLMDWVRNSFSIASIGELTTQFVVAKLGSVNCAAILKPDSEESLIPRFLLFNEHYVDVPFELPSRFDFSPNDCLAKAKFDPQRKTVLLLHGYITGYTLLDGLTNIKNRFLDLNKVINDRASTILEEFLRQQQQFGNYTFVVEDLTHKLKQQQYNVIIVDWFNGANPVPRSRYIRAAVNAQVVGQLIARFLKKLIERCGTRSDQIQIIAHSLGCHVAGFAGKAMNSMGYKLGKIVHLDPIGLCFGRLFSEPKYRLSPDDAWETQAVHVSLNIFDNPLDGTQSNILVNGGRDQLGCDGMSELQNSTTSSLALLVDSEAKFNPCSHMRALSLYEDDLSSEPGQCQIVGYKCQTYDQFLAGKCGRCDAQNRQCKLMSLPPIYPISLRNYMNEAEQRQNNNILPILNAARTRLREVTGSLQHLQHLMRDNATSIDALNAELALVENLVTSDGYRFDNTNHQQQQHRLDSTVQKVVASIRNGDRSTMPKLLSRSHYQLEARKDLTIEEQTTSEEVFDRRQTLAPLSTRIKLRLIGGGNNEIQSGNNGNKENSSKNVGDTESDSKNNNDHESENQTNPTTGDRTKRILTGDQRDRIIQTIQKIRTDTRNALADSWTSLKNGDSKFKVGTFIKSPLHLTGLPFGDGEAEISSIFASPIAPLPPPPSSSPSPASPLTPGPSTQIRPLPINTNANGQNNQYITIQAGGGAGGSSGTNSLVRLRDMENVANFEKFTMPLGGQSAPEGSVMGPLYFVGTGSVSPYCVNYYQFRMLFLESRIKGFAADGAAKSSPRVSQINSHRLTPTNIEPSKISDQISEQSSLSRQAISNKNTLHLTIKLTDSSGHYWKGFTLTEDVRTLTKVHQAESEGYKNENLIELTMLLNTTKLEPVRISGSVISYYFHGIVLADRIEVNYMSNISPQVRAKYSSLLCPVAINDEQKLVRYVECEKLH